MERNVIYLIISARDLMNNRRLELLVWKGVRGTKTGSVLTVILFGTTHIHIPIVSGSIEEPNGKTSSWSKTLLRMYDFPLRQGPAIDTTQTGPSGRRRHQKHKFIDPFIHIIRKLFYYGQKSWNEKKLKRFRCRNYVHHKGSSSCLW